MRRRRLPTTALGFAAAVAVLAGIFLAVDTGEVRSALVRADPVLVGVVAGLILSWNVCWGLGLWNVLRSLEVEMSPQAAVLIHAVAAFVDNVTPFGQLGGEPVTAWLISRRTEVDYEVGFASITGFDAVNVVPSLSLAGIGLVYVLRVDPPAADLGTALKATAVVILAVPLIGFAVWRYRETTAGYLTSLFVLIGRMAERLVDRFEAPSRPRVGERLHEYVRALEVVGGSRYRLGAALGWSSAGWLCQAVALWVAFEAVGSSIPVYVPLLVIPLGRLAAATPTPGGLGGIEAVNVTLVVLLTAVPAGVAAVAVTLHSVGGYLLTVGVGASIGSYLGVREYDDAVPKP